MRRQRHASINLRKGLMGVMMVACAVAATAIAAAPARKPLRLTAFAVDLAGGGTTRAEHLNIVIEHWSTDAERDRLIATLGDKGSDRLLSELQAIKPRAGYIRTNTSLGWDIQYAQQFKMQDGGRKIVFATDRPISIAERQSADRSLDYDFILCEIHLGPNDRGEGKLATMARITYDKANQQIEVEDYSFEPVRLTDVTAES